MKKVITSILCLFAVFSSQAQVKIANFGVDGDFYANYRQFGSFTASGSDDWFNRTSGTGVGVIDTNGGAAFLTFLKADRANRNAQFTVGMSVPFFSIRNGNRLLDARYNRDNHKSAIMNDSTMYPTSSKNGENPLVWSHGIGNVNSKNDIVDFYAHYRRNGTGNTDSLWLYGSITTIDNTGSRYNDFEIYRSALNYDQSAGFTGSGSDSGHVAWTFDASGNVTKAGDMIVATSYSNSGVNTFEVRIWTRDTNFNYVTPAKFKWGSNFDGDGNNAKFGYATVLPINASSVYYYSYNNANDTTGASPWQTFDGQTDSLRTTYLSNQMIEFGVNLSLLGLDPASISGFNAACDDISLKVMCKSRSSASFTSQLQDFSGPVPFGDFPDISTFSSVTYNPLCASATSKQLIGSPNPVYDPSTLIYQWNSYSGGVIVGDSTNDTVVVSKTGLYILTMSLLSGCSNSAAKDTFYVVADNDCDGLVDLNDVDDDDDGILDVVEACGYGATSFACVGGDPGLDADADNIPNYKDANFCTLNSKGVCASLDFDGDGIINQYDRDSDNDGIPDLIEAGGIDINGDGKIDTLIDSDLDGIMDKYDVSCNGGTTSNRANVIVTSVGSINNQANIIDTDTTTYGELASSGAYVVLQLQDTVLAGTQIKLRVASSGSSPTTFEIIQDSILTGKYYNTQSYSVSGSTPQTVTYTLNSATSKIRIKRTSLSNYTRLYSVKYSFLNCSGNIGTAITNADVDGDGIRSYLDLDSDNDGIPDLVEAGGADDNNDGYVDDYNPTTKNFTKTDYDNDGYSSVYDADTNSTGITNAQVKSGGLVTSGPLIITGADGNNDGKPNSYPNGDPDGDVKLNMYDLDDDGDGIVDLVEVGGTDSNRDGKVDSYTDSDGDGWNNTQDGFGTSNGNTPLVSPSIDANDNGYPDGTTRWTTDNPDGDKYANFIDIDSDGDGITDNTEAQATASYVAPGGTDTNGDGLDDAYGTTSGSKGLVPVNTDGTDNQDYLDLDSDNDGYSDAIEGHDTDGDNIADAGSNANNGVPTGLDIDFDGLDDGYDNNTASYNATNGSLTPSSHPNIDLAATSERDWREPVYAIYGQVFNDRGGMTDNIVNGVGIDVASGSQLYVYLVDSVTGRIIRKSMLNTGNGTYNFQNLNKDTAYIIKVSTSNLALYASGSSINSLPANWASTGENFGTYNVLSAGNESGTANSQIGVKIGTANVTGINFGIEQRPLGTDKTAASQVNLGGTVTVRTPSLAATDLEDGTKGQGSKFKISTLPTNAT
ncbi:MAG: hypothetical protein SGJ10_02820, partial [Bacteroidota bacterium]|nr:hypothetical protein [Bacteroidota bacterium]